MTWQPPHPNSPLSRQRLLYGASLISLAGILTCGIAVAQTPEPTADAVPIAPAPVVPEPTAAEIAPPETLPPDPAAIEQPIAPEFSAPPALPETAESIAPAPELPTTTEPYIDATDYSLGATDRTDPAALLAPPALAAERAIAEPILSAAPTAVQIGPLTIGDTGLGLATTTPKVRDFYNRTVRPPALLGNGNIRLMFPLSIPAPITSLFGWRIHPLSGDQRFHSGTDLGAPMGTPVLAAYAGQVAIADFLGGYGLAVTLSHNNGAQETLYGHLSEIFVKPGEQVKQGMVIGRVGSTGNSTGPHLHFEFRQQTPDGWVALDAGAQLEYALAQLAKAMQIGQLPQAPGEFGELAKTNLNLGKVARFTIAMQPPAPTRNAATVPTKPQSSF